MACLQDVADRIETSRLVIRIWEMFDSITNGSQPSDWSQLEYLFKWYDDTLDSNDMICKMKKSEGSDCEYKLDLFDEEGLKLDWGCLHRDGVSFDSLISRKAIAVCSYVSTFVFFKCFLFVSGVALEKFKDTESVSDMSGLTDRLSSLSNKWNLSFGTDSCEDGVLELWSDQISGVDDEEDAMKMLYQQILAPLSAVLEVVSREKTRLDGVGDLNAEACRAKWGDELCKLLQILDGFFNSSDTEFLYEEFFEWHCWTAERLLTLGNHNRARELFDAAKKKLDGIGDDTPLVPKWGKNQPIKYQPLALDPLEKYRREYRVLEGLLNATGQDSYFNDLVETKKQMRMVIERIWGNDPEKYASEKGYLRSLFCRQLFDITELVHRERYSEAEKMFKQLDPERSRSKWILRKLLEDLNSRTNSPSLSWESFCQKQNLFLDVSEDLGDSQLTATFLQQYGISIGHRSLRRLPKQYRWRPRAYGIGIDNSAEDGEVSTLNLWLKEELNLQFPSPASACVQEVISCLRNGCSVGEHKRELPEMLKACRLLKRSIDIYSDLLHNWTQGLSNEAEWLQLLESRKFVHDTLKSYLLVLYGFCIELKLEIIFDVTTFGQVDLPTKISDGAEEVCTALMMSAMVWVERGRARSLLSQLGPWYSMIKHGDENPGSLKDELIRFDKDEEVATAVSRYLEPGTISDPQRKIASNQNNRPNMLLANAVKFLLCFICGEPLAALSSIIYSCQLACSSGSKPLFVEYVSLGHMYAVFFIEDVGEDEPFYEYSFRETFRVTVEDLKNLPDEDSEKLQLAGVDLADDALDKLPDEDLEKLADPKTVNKLLYVFYKIVPRQKNSNKECVVAKLHSILEKLYDILIRPFWEKTFYNLRDLRAPVIFVPDKMLYRVPFALLRDKKTKKYLFELHTISIAPSLRVLQHCALRLHDLENFPLKRECILAVGNPAYDNADDLLPGTGKELKHLRECFLGRVKILKKHEATRSKFLEQVKQASFSEDRHVFAFMHLGVHGHWSEVELHKTGSLQFAAPPSADISTGQLRTGQSHTSELEQESGEQIISSDDGDRHRSAFGEVGAITRAGGCSSSATDLAMLPSEDIIRSGIEWRTRLVVLSACNSSRGQDYYDGEVNLPRALMIAGVPAAVVSQWKIDDDASPVLMKELYERLRNGEGVASALQSAMIHTRQCTDCRYQPDSAQNIFQWGSFVVWGLPSVTLPEDLYYDHVKAQLLDYTKLNTLLASADNMCALDKNTIDDAIFAVERILASPWGSASSFVSQVVEVYTLVPLEDISRVELFFETNDRLEELFSFRCHLMFAHAMKGSHQKALECIDWMIAFGLSLGCAYDDLILQAYRQERAVIWRLMGEYDRALEEFNSLLAFGEDYECLTQMSYLKHLMDDTSGALEYARRAKCLQRPELEKPGFLSKTLMTLGVRALPDKYRRWLVNVDEPFTALAKIKTYTISGNPGATVTMLNED